MMIMNSEESELNKILTQIKTQTLNSINGSLINKKQLNLLLLNLRQISRDISQKTRNLKESTQKEKEEFEKVYLQLKSTENEKVELEKDLKGMEFSCVYESVDLYCLEDFYEKNKENRLSDLSEHELMVKRLEFELEERKRMVDKVKEAEEECEMVLRKIKEQRNNFIDKLDSQFEGILKLTRSLQEMVEFNSEEYLKEKLAEKEKLVEKISMDVDGEEIVKEEEVAEELNNSRGRHEKVDADDEDNDSLLGTEDSKATEII